MFFDSGYLASGSGFWERKIVLMDVIGYSGISGDSDIPAIHFPPKHPVGITQVEIVDAKSTTMFEVSTLEITGSAVTEFLKPSIGIKRFAICDRRSAV